MKKGIIFTIEAIIAIAIIMIAIGALVNTNPERLEELNLTKITISAGTALNFGESYIEEAKENYYCVKTTDYNLFSKTYLERKACGGFQ